MLNPLLGQDHGLRLVLRTKRRIAILQGFSLAGLGLGQRRKVSRVLLLHVVDPVLARDQIGRERLGRLPADDAGVGLVDIGLFHLGKVAVQHAGRLARQLQALGQADAVGQANFRRVNTGL